MGADATSIDTWTPRIRNDAQGHPVISSFCTLATTQNFVSPFDLGVECALVLLVHQRYPFATVTSTRSSDLGGYAALTSSFLSLHPFGAPELLSFATAPEPEAQELDPIMKNPLMCNPDVIRSVAAFVCDEAHLFFTLVCTEWKEAWGRRPKFTRAITSSCTVMLLPYCFDCGLGRTKEVCDAIASLGNVELLECALNHGCNWSFSTQAAAAEGGHLGMLQWAHEKGCEWNWWTCDRAARAGRLDILEWAHANGCPWAEATCSAAAAAGHFSILQWLKKEKCPWDVDTCSEAASAGHLEILQWARKHGCPWDKDTCSAAAAGGHLEVLQWARGHGCPWGADTCQQAASGGHLAVLQWARSHSCPWDRNTTTHAKYHGHEEIYDWAVANDCPLDPAIVSAENKPLSPHAIHRLIVWERFAGRRGRHWAGRGAEHSREVLFNRSMEEGSDSSMEDEW